MDIRPGRCVLKRARRTCGGEGGGGGESPQCTPEKRRLLLPRGPQTDHTREAGSKLMSVHTLTQGVAHRHKNVGMGSIYVRGCG